MRQEKPIALWAMPRSKSAVFERIFVERDGFEAFHEPFGGSYQATATSPRIIFAGQTDLPRQEEASPEI